ncbi:MAG: right-handed parallel beta-helix repeat-containing protein, partial [Verrucomicrobia bacterium]|nr:right-handed parallel beta-helix repeat-containing protein [Verrucomicrobiota bacterium]
MKISRLGILLLLAFSATHAFSATRHVWTNSPYPAPPYNAWSNASHTIQSALDAAVDDDTVLVTNGVYALLSQLDVTNEVIIQSVNGADVTLIDGNRPVTSNRCFSIVASNVTIEGFTIKNGTATNDNSGGGIEAYGTALVVRSCIVVSNRAENGGGGFYLSGDYALLEDCLIANNTANTGGGVSIQENALIRNCVVRGNRGVYGPGGVYCENGSSTTATLHNCFISGNLGQRGGGVEQSYGPMELRHCTISGNTAEFEGGGLLASGPSYSRTVIQNTVVYFNKATRNA